MKPDIWEPPAAEELEAAIAVSRDPAAFREAIADAIEAIATGRMTHTMIPRTRCRECILTTPPYSIIYTETTTEIRVWAFAHHKRRRGYWKNRLP